MKTQSQIVSDILKISGHWLSEENIKNGWKKFLKESKVKTFDSFIPTTENKESVWYLFNRIMLENLTPLPTTISEDKSDIATDICLNRQQYIKKMRSHIETLKDDIVKYSLPMLEDIEDQEENSTDVVEEELKRYSEILSELYQDATFDFKISNGEDEAIFKSINVIADYDALDLLYPGYIMGVVEGKEESTPDGSNIKKYGGYNVIQKIESVNEQTLSNVKNGIKKLETTISKKFPSEFKKSLKEAITLGIDDNYNTPIILMSKEFIKLISESFGITWKDASSRYNLLVSGVDPKLYTLKDMLGVFPKHSKEILDLLGVKAIEGIEHKDLSNNPYVLYQYGNKAIVNVASIIKELNLNANLIPTADFSRGAETDAVHNGTLTSLLKLYPKQQELILKLFGFDSMAGLKSAMGQKDIKKSLSNNKFVIGYSMGEVYKAHGGTTLPANRGSLDTLIKNCNNKELEDLSKLFGIDFSNKDWKKDNAIIDKLENNSELVSEIEHLPDPNNYTEADYERIKKTKTKQFEENRNYDGSGNINVIVNYRKIAEAWGLIGPDEEFISKNKLSTDPKYVPDPDKNKKINKKIRLLNKFINKLPGAEKSTTSAKTRATEPIVDFDKIIDYLNLKPLRLSTSLSGDIVEYGDVGKSKSMLSQYVHQPKPVNPNHLVEKGEPKKLNVLRTISQIINTYMEDNKSGFGGKTEEQLKTDPDPERNPSSFNKTIDKFMEELKLGNDVTVKEFKTSILKLPNTDGVVIAINDLIKKFDDLNNDTTILEFKRALSRKSRLGVGVTTSVDDIISNVMKKLDLNVTTQEFRKALLKQSTNHLPDMLVELAQQAKDIREEFIIPNLERINIKNDELYNLLYFGSLPKNYSNYHKRDKDPIMSSYRKYIRSKDMPSTVYGMEADVLTGKKRAPVVSDISKAWQSYGSIDDVLNDTLTNDDQKEKLIEQLTGDVAITIIPSSSEVKKPYIKTYVSEEEIVNDSELTSLQKRMALATFKKKVKQEPKRTNEHLDDWFIDLVDYEIGAKKYDDEQPPQKLLNHIVDELSQNPHPFFANAINKLTKSRDIKMSDINKIRMLISDMAMYKHNEFFADKEIDNEENDELDTKLNYDQIKKMVDVLISNGYFDGLDLLVGVGAIIKGLSYGGLKINSASKQLLKASATTGDKDTIKWATNILRNAHNVPEINLKEIFIERDDDDAYMKEIYGINKNLGVDPKNAIGSAIVKIAKSMGAKKVSDYKKFIDKNSDLIIELYGVDKIMVGSGVEQIIDDSDFALTKDGKIKINLLNPFEYEPGSDGYEKIIKNLEKAKNNFISKIKGVRTIKKSEQKSVYGIMQNYEDFATIPSKWHPSAPSNLQNKFNELTAKVKMLVKELAASIWENKNPDEKITTSKLVNRVKNDDSLASNPYFTKQILNELITPGNIGYVGPRQKELARTDKNAIVKNLEATHKAYVAVVEKGKEKFDSEYVKGLKSELSSIDDKIKSTDDELEKENLKQRKNAVEELIETSMLYTNNTTSKFLRNKYSLQSDLSQINELIKATDDPAEQKELENEANNIQRKLDRIEKNEKIIHELVGGGETYKLELRILKDKWDQTIKLLEENDDAEEEERLKDEIAKIRNKIQNILNVLGRYSVNTYTVVVGRNISITNKQNNKTFVINLGDMGSEELQSSFNKSIQSIGDENSSSKLSQKKSGKLIYNVSTQDMRSLLQGLQVPLEPGKETGYKSNAQMFGPIIGNALSLMDKNNKNFTHVKKQIQNNKEEIAQSLKEIHTDVGKEFYNRPDTIFDPGERIKGEEEATPKTAADYVSASTTSDRQEKQNIEKLKEVFSDPDQIREIESMARKGERAFNIAYHMTQQQKEEEE